MNKKESILNTALRLFSESGVQATPTSLIAKEAGVATGTLFHHFKTKERLILSLFKSIQSSQNEALLLGAKEGDTFRELLARACHNYLRWADQNREAFRFLRQFYASPLVTLIPEEHALALPKPLADRYREAMGRGEVKRLPEDLFYLLFQQQVYSMFLYTTASGSEWEMKVKEGMLSSELFWDMIKTHKQTD